MPDPVLVDVQARLEECRDRVQDLREQLAAELKRRDALVVEMIDAGGAQRATAKAAGVGNTRVVAILCGSEPDAVLPR